MDRVMGRAFSILAVAALIGCGDDGSREDDVEEDASVEEGPAAGRGGRGGNGGRGGTGGARAGNGGSASGAGGASGSASGSSCDDLDCKEPATCKETDGRASCACPEGYDDVNGDGSQCEDDNECASAEDNDCAPRAKCENKPGGYECKCPEPAYTGDGKTCGCAEGYAEEEGFCVGDDGKACEDDLDCKNGNCESGICCAQACNVPGAECKTAEGATCKDGKTCEYPTAPNGADCEDGNFCLAGSKCEDGQCKAGTEPVTCNDENPCTDDSCDPAQGCRAMPNTASCDDSNACTSSDVCANGSCSGTLSVTCDSEVDQCNAGMCDPATGDCKKVPVADGTACDDANSCTLTDRCNAGSCGGEGNACGRNASACAPGTTNTCTCNDGFLAEDGLCVPETNECDDDPCSPNATCFDPSNGGGDVECTCEAGFEGDGRTCTATEPCAGNPCGADRGTCTPGAAGTYTCACSPGFRAVGEGTELTCGCDLSGTFVARTSLEFVWSNMDGIEDGEDDAFTWSILRADYNDDGDLELESINCGDSEIDYCGTGIAVLGPEAYAQYGDVKALGISSAPVTNIIVENLEGQPNTPFVTPMFATLSGISLADPLGPWPVNRRDVEGGAGEFDGSALNGARWVDHDADGFFGYTTYAVPPGGVSNQGDGPRPLKNYGARSEVCPRNNPNGERLAYAYPPAIEGLATVRRVKRFYSANRSTSSYDGTIESCDRITGNVRGPNNGRINYEAVIGGCIRDNNGGDVACSPAVLDFLQEPAGGSQTANSATFVMERVEDAATMCPAVRAHDFN